MNDLQANFPVKVYTLWVTQEHDTLNDCPQLEAAWTEFDIEENPVGWGEAVADLNDGRFRAVREIVLTVDFDKVMAAFQPTEIEASHD